MWVTYVVSGFLSWISVAADVIRNNLWVLETRRFGRKTCPADAAANFHLVLSLAFPAFKSPWEINHQYSTLMWKTSSLPRQSISGIRLTNLSHLTFWRSFVMEGRTQGWVSGRFAFEFQLCHWPAVWLQTSRLTSLSPHSRIWKTGELFLPYSVVRIKWARE